MSASSLIGAEIQILGTGVTWVNTPSTVIFDFGLPAGDLHLPSQAGFTPGCRVIILFAGAIDTNGAGDDTVEFEILDGTDNNGQIGDKAPAITDDGVPIGSPGHRSLMFGLQMQANRPWLRCMLRHTNPDTTVIGRAIVLAIPRV